MFSQSVMFSDVIDGHSLIIKSSVQMRVMASLYPEVVLQISCEEEKVLQRYSLKYVQTLIFG